MEYVSVMIALVCMCVFLYSFVKKQYGVFKYYFVVLLLFLVASRYGMLPGSPFTQAGLDVKQFWVSFLFIVFTTIAFVTGCIGLYRYAIMTKEKK